jgi:hypothetical protein
MILVVWLSRSSSRLSPISLTLTWVCLLIVHLPGGSDGADAAAAAGDDAIAAAADIMYSCTKTEAATRLTTNHPLSMFVGGGGSVATLVCLLWCVCTGCKLQEASKQGVNQIKLQSNKCSFGGWVVLVRWCAGRRLQSKKSITFYL